MESSLYGPDVSNAHVAVIEEVGDRIEVWSRQFVNRWVFLKHQRPAALKELKELLQCHTEILSASASSTANGTDSTGDASVAASAGGGLPTLITDAVNASGSEPHDPKDCKNGASGDHNGDGHRDCGKPPRKHGGSFVSILD